MSGTIKTYEVYACIRVTEDVLKNTSLDTIQEAIRKSLKDAGWPADDMWVEDALEDELVLDDELLLEEDI